MLHMLITLYAGACDFVKLLGRQALAIMIAVTGAAISVSPAIAETQQNFYMTGGIGNAVVDPNTLDISSETTSMYHIGIGLPLTEHFAAEYSRMMEIATDRHRPNHGNFSIDTTVDSFAVIAKAPISEQLMDIEALLGISFSDVSYSSNVLSVKDYWLVPGLNLGVQHRVTDKFSLRFERYLVRSEIEISGNRLSLLFEF